jgi:hypothetical protein
METLNASDIKNIIDGKTPPVSGQDSKTDLKNEASTPEKNKSKANDDSGEIMGGGLPDPHPA